MGEQIAELQGSNPKESLDLLNTQITELSARIQKIEENNAEKASDTIEPQIAELSTRIQKIEENIAATASGTTEQVEQVDESKLPPALRMGKKYLLIKKKNKLIELENAKAV